MERFEAVLTDLIHILSLTEKRSISVLESERLLEMLEGNKKPTVTTYFRKDSEDFDIPYKLCPTCEKPMLLDVIEPNKIEWNCPNCSYKTKKREFDTYDKIQDLINNPIQELKPKYQTEMGEITILYEDLEKRVIQIKKTIHLKRDEMKGIGKIMEELDELYHYALELIGKEKTHSLGHKKELLKQTIESVIKQ